MKKVFLTLGVCVLATHFLSGQAWVGKYNYDEPMVDYPMWNPCANDGDGEWIIFNGLLHVVSHLTIDNEGTWHLKWHSQPHHLVGNGQITGDNYNGVGVTQGYMKFGGANFPVYIETEIDNTYFICERNGDTAKLKGRLHITINAIDDMTAYVDDMSMTCK